MKLGSSYETSDALGPCFICLVISLAIRRIFRLMVEYQWFLMALSVLQHHMHAHETGEAGTARTRIVSGSHLPGKSLAISAHLLPRLFCAS